MSDVLFLNSPLADQNFDLSKEDYVPPLGLAQVATSVKSHGFDVELFDASNLGISTSQTITCIQEKSPRVVALNVFSTNKTQILSILKHFSTSIKFIVGGAGVKGLEYEILQTQNSEGIDVVIGDGELITPHLLLERSDLNPIRKVNNNRLFSIDSSSEFYNWTIDSAQIDRSLLLFDGIGTHNGCLEACIVTTRGCIYNCAFCGSATSRNLNNMPRKRSTIDIQKEIQSLINLTENLAYIRVIDDLFLRNRDSILEATSLFARFKPLRWRAMAHINSFNNVNMSELTQFNVVGGDELFIGVESGSPSILRKIHKISDIDKIKTVVRNILLAGINLKIFLIYGFPMETEEDMKMTYELAMYLKEIEKMTTGKVRFSVFRYRPYENTELYELHFQDADSHRLIHDSRLSKRTGRPQFNFRSSDIEDSINDLAENYIELTTQLNNQ